MTKKNPKTRLGLNLASEKNNNPNKKKSNGANNKNFTFIHWPIKPHIITLLNPKFRAQ